MEITFHFRTRAIITDKDAVLVTRFKGADYTFLPGGHIETGESIPQALVRELKEELGKEAKIIKYLGAIEQSWIKGEKGRQYEINHIFACEIPGFVSTNMVASMEDRYEFLWLKPEEFEKNKLLSETARGSIKNYLAGDASTWWSSTWLD